MPPAPIGWLVDLARRAGASVTALVRKPGTPEPVPPAERELRALAALRGPRLYYCLGAGGRGEIAGEYVPHRDDPPPVIAARRARGKVYSDCSGGVAGAMGIHRRIRGYARGWDYFSTDGVIRDADDPAVELVQWVPEGGSIEPWCGLVVYGSEDTDGDGDRDRIGHIGLVCGVPPGWVYTGPASLERLQVWHVAASANPNGACRISDGRPWARRGRLLAIL